jgi:hypothetical protein
MGVDLVSLPKEDTVEVFGMCRGEYSDLRDGKSLVIQRVPFSLG